MGNEERDEWKQSQQALKTSSLEALAKLTSEQIAELPTAELRAIAIKAARGW
ncbi:MAG: hypothetical protein Q8R08_03905 [bacterium]|nr:hypothetical protein [bacterium]